MAWHVLHNLLENCRKISTFPGKLWIMVMFAFRMVMIARVGDQVYGDEQEQFVCNTNTPGCNQVCYSKFAPISHLRFWSAMVIITATPPIVFLAYATNLITRNERKKEESKFAKIREREERLVKKAHKKKHRHVMNSLRNRKHAGSASGARTRAPKSNFSDQGSISRHTMSPLKTKPDEEDRLIQPNGAGPNAHVGNLADPPLYFTDNDGAGYPVYDGKNNKYVTYIERSPSTRKAAEFPGKYRPLHHPDIARAYWWQVLIRTAVEGVFLWLQYDLFGFQVPFKYICIGDPCPQATECWVSRSYEKTIFLWFMFVVGSVSVLLGLAEFWSLGLQRLKVAFCFSRQTKVQKQHKKRPSLSNLEHMDLTMDMERFSIVSFGNSGSSGSTISSV